MKISFDPIFTILRDIQHALTSYPCQPLENHRSNIEEAQTSVLVTTTNDPDVNLGERVNSAVYISEVSSADQVIMFTGFAPERGDFVGVRFYRRKEQATWLDVPTKYYDAYKEKDRALLVLDVATFLFNCEPLH